MKLKNLKKLIRKSLLESFKVLVEKYAAVIEETASYEKKRRKYWEYSVRIGDVTQEFHVRTSKKGDCYLEIRITPSSNYDSELKERFFKDLIQTDYVFLSDRSPFKLEERVLESFAELFCQKKVNPSKGIITVQFSKRYFDNLEKEINTGKRTEELSNAIFNYIIRPCCLLLNPYKETVKRMLSQI